MKLKNILLTGISLIMLLGFMVESSNAQCTTSIDNVTPPSGSTSFTSTFEGSTASQATAFTFNGGTLPAGWTATPYQIGQPCSVNSLDNSNYFWATTRNSSGHRFVMTNSLDVSHGGYIYFDFRLGHEGAPCEDADQPAEGVYLQYTIDNGASWHEIDYWEPKVDNSFYLWIAYQRDIPAPAQTTNTKFRWIQFSSSGDSFDNWGLDNVSVSATIAAESWNWDIDGTTYTTENPTHTFPDYGTYNVSLTTENSAGCIDTEITTHVVNSVPTINAVADQVGNLAAPSQSINLDGITDGGIGGQVISVRAVSSNPAVCTNPTISYTSPNATATLNYNALAVGNTTITVYVEYTNVLLVQKDITFNLQILDDVTDPVITSCASNKNLDANENCQAILGDYTSEVVATDDYDTDLTITQSPIAGTTIAGATNTITITVTDDAGNQAQCTFNAAVIDNANPTVITQNHTAELDASGNVNITTLNINNGSTDNCGIASMSLDITSFDCSNLGTNTVTLTVTDDAGNSSSNTATVTVVDNILPTVLTQDITVNLDASGQATITSNQINNGSTDNCSVANLSLDQTTFNCDDVGPNTVTLTVTDNSGNVNTNTAIVTVQDIELPVINTPADIVVNSSATSCTQVVNFNLPTVTDNCLNCTAPTTLPNYTFLGVIEGHTYFRSNFSTSWTSANSAAQALGGHLVTITSQEENDLVVGNGGNAWIGLTDKDSEDNFTWVTGEPFDYDSWATGEPNDYGSGEDYVVTNWNEAGKWNDLDNASAPNPFILEFDCAAAIPTQTAGLASGSDFPVGTTTNTFTYTDANGNTGTASFTVTVIDNTNPTVHTNNLTIELDENGLASITTAQVNNASTDNCAVANTSLDITDFDCSNIGNNTVTLTVTDIYGNSASNTAIVTIVDLIVPTVNTQDITVQLDADGLATIAATEIDNVSTDNCSIDNFTLDITDFNCEDVGENTVTLTVTDVNGNSSSNTATVSVEDNIIPTVLTQNITIQLDNDGLADITTSDIDNGSIDNCAIATMSLDITDFDCTNVGENTVILTVTDVNGNTNTNTAIVTVEDTVDPIVITTNITANLDETGVVSILPEDINNASSDNCAIHELTIDISDFDCEDVGENTVTLTAIDVNGNSASETAIVTVVDLVAPVVTNPGTQEITSADNCIAVLPDFTTDLVYSDNCGVATLVQTPAPGSEYDLNIGIVSVNIVVSDLYGNSTSVEFDAHFHDPLAFEITGVDFGHVTTCNGYPDGFIIVNTTVDSNLLQYSIHNNEQWQWNNNHFIDLQPETHIVRARNMNGCIEEWPEPITILPAPEITLTSIVVDDFIECYGSANGSIEINVAGGTGEFLYSVDGGNNWQEDHIFNNLDAGTYQIQVTDAVECTYEHHEAIVIAQVEELVISSLEATDVTGCYDQSNGTITISATGGTSAYEYSIDNGQNWTSSSTFTNLDAGTYNVWVKDENDCVSEYENNPIHIQQPTALTIASVTSTNVICNGADNGVISIYAQGGSGNLECSVNNGQTWEQTPDFENLSAGEYNIIVKDANGCEAIYPNNPVIITEPTALQITYITMEEAVCNQDYTGIKIYAVGGIGEYEYSIDNGDNWVSSNEMNIDSGEEYQVLVRDENGCEQTYLNNPITFEAIYSSELDIEVSPEDEVCAGETITLSAVSNDALELVWNPGNETSTQIEISEAVGIHTYTVTGTNMNNCVSQKSIEITFTDCTNVGDIEESNIKLYPNPNNGNFIIELSTNESPKTIRVINTHGKTLFEKDQHQIPAALSFEMVQLKPGVYYVQIEFEEKMIIKKMIVQK